MKTNTGLIAALALLSALVLLLALHLQAAPEPLAGMTLLAPVSFGVYGVLAALFLVTRVLPDFRRERWRREFARKGTWNAEIAHNDRLQARRRWIGFVMATATGLAGVLAFLGVPADELSGAWAFLASGRVSVALKSLALLLMAGGLCGQAVLLVVVPEEPPEQEAPTMPFNGLLTVEQAHDLVGREGRVQAALRPQGNLKLDEQTYVVKSEGHFVDEGTPVRVDRIDGPNIVVVPVREEG